MNSVVHSCRQSRYLLVNTCDMSLAAVFAASLLHQVRLLVAAAGLEVLALKRVRVGGFVMPRNIKRGGYM